MNNRIVLYDEMENEVEFEIITTFGIDDDNYAALIPIDDEPLTYLLKYEQDDNGNIVLTTIDDDEEFEYVKEVYEEIQKERLH